MRKTSWLLAALLGASLAPVAWAQSGATQTNQRSTSQARQQSAKTNSSSPSRSTGQEPTADIQAGTQVSAELLTTLDARKLHPGSQVVARVTKDVKQDGRTVVHKGSRLLGRVTSVQASGKGQAASEVGVQFDQLAQGHAVSQLNTVVTAVFARPAPGMMSQPDMMPPMAAPMPVGGQPAGRGGGGLVGGAVSTAGSAAGSTAGSVGGAASTVGSVGSSTVGTVNQTAGGVGGAVANQTTAGARNNAALGAPLGNVIVGSSAEANQQTQASVFTSKQGNLRLDSGTQMEFQVTGQAQAQPRVQPQPPPKR